MDLRTLAITIMGLSLLACGDESVIGTPDTGSPDAGAPDTVADDTAAGDVASGDTGHTSDTGADDDSHSPVDVPVDTPPTGCDACPEDTFCHEGACAPKRAAGEACADLPADACATEAGCVDGVCCLTACDAGACSRCQAGSGTCGPASADVVCGEGGASLCDGVSMACPADCDLAEDAGCASGFYCDTTRRPARCAAQAEGFWTTHILPEEIVDGARRVFYVSSSVGDDSSGDGSQDNPFRSVNRAYLDVRTQVGAYTGIYQDGSWWSPAGSQPYKDRGIIGEVKRGHYAILLRRGDVFEILHEEAYLIAAGKKGLASGRYASLFLGLEVSGKSATERFIVATYGEGGATDYSGPRPVINLTWPKAQGNDVANQGGVAAFGVLVSPYGTGVAPPAPPCEDESGEEISFEACSARVRTLEHVTIAGIEIRPSDPRAGLYYRDHRAPSVQGVQLQDGLVSDLLLEDLYIHHTGRGVVWSHQYGLMSNPAGSKHSDMRLTSKGVRIRRCVFANIYAGKAGEAVSGAIQGRKFDEVLVEECVFDEIPWDPHVDPVTIFDPDHFADLLPGVDTPPFDHTSNPQAPVGVYEAAKSGHAWGAFHRGASPHSVYIRAESGDRYVARGNIVLRSGSARDKWESGVMLVNSLYIQGGAFVGSDNAMGTIDEGLGFWPQTSARNNAFLSDSQLYNDYALAMRGGAHEAVARRNLFRTFQDTRRPIFTLQNLTGAPITVTYTMKHSERSVSVGDQVFSKSADDNLANLCNWFNTLALPGEGIRCAMRRNQNWRLSWSESPLAGDPEAPVEHVLANDGRRYVIYSSGNGPGGTFGPLEVLNKFVVLEVAGDVIQSLLDAGYLGPLYPVDGDDLHPKSGSYGGLRVEQPATGAGGWIHRLEEAYPFKKDGATHWRLRVRQGGSYVGSPRFVGAAEGGGALVFSMGHGTHPEGQKPADVAPVQTDFAYTVEEPLPVRVEENVFHVHHPETDSQLVKPGTGDGSKPHGHAIRICGVSSQLQITSNLFYAPIPFTGVDLLPEEEGWGPYNRADLIHITPYCHYHIANPALHDVLTQTPGDHKAKRQAAVDTFNGLMGVPALTWSDIASGGLTLTGNRALTAGGPDGIIGFGAHEAQWSLAHTYSTFDAFCAATEGPTLVCDANLLTDDEAAWDAASGPAPAGMVAATFAAYRASLGLALAPDRYQNSSALDRELDMMSDALRAKRRGAWSTEYDAYDVNNAFRAQYGLPAVRRPYTTP